MNHPPGCDCRLCDRSFYTQPEARKARPLDLWECAGCHAEVPAVMLAQLEPAGTAAAGVLVFCGDCAEQRV